MFPITVKSMDLALVITPESATMVMLGLGGMALLLRKCRKAATSYLFIGRTLGVGGSHGPPTFLAPGGLIPP